MSIKKKYIATISNINSFSPNSFNIIGSFLKSPTFKSARKAKEWVYNQDPVGHSGGTYIVRIRRVR